MTETPFEREPAWPAVGPACRVTIPKRALAGLPHFALFQSGVLAYYAAIGNAVGDYAIIADRRGTPFEP
jgi:hypothetical protein